LLIVPFEKTVASEQVKVYIEKNDIGGISLIRAAAKTSRILL
jgi:AICAR transformylase/IMP cyclohydrolase PurH